MKRLIITIVAFAVSICLLVGVLSGCASTQTDSSEENYNEDEQAHQKLVIVSKEVSLTWSAYCLMDIETGVEYWFVRNGYGGGMTPRLNTDGSCVVVSVPTVEGENE